MSPLSQAIRIIPVCKNGAVYNSYSFKGFIDYQVIRKINETKLTDYSLLNCIRNVLDKYGNRLHYPVCKFGDNSKIEDAEFEKWLYEHGICNPNIHESIPCDAVPLLIDNAISELPSAQLERKKGEWIPVTNGRGGFECNRCHCYAPSYQDGVEWLSAFCPNCGADMRGEQDE